MAGLTKITVFFLIIACTMLLPTEAVNNWVRVGPCDKVCNRSNPEKDACCRAHGQGYHANCSGGMNCYRR